MDFGSILQHCWHCGSECFDSVDPQTSKSDVHHLSDNTGMSNRHNLVINYVEELLKKSSTSCKKATAYVNKIGTCVGEHEICEMKR